MERLTQRGAVARFGSSYACLMGQSLTYVTPCIFVFEDLKAPLLNHRLFHGFSSFSPLCKQSLFVLHWQRQVSVAILICLDAWLQSATSLIFFFSAVVVCLFVCPSFLVHITKYTYICICKSANH